MFEQKRFAGRHLLTFESQKFNYFAKKSGVGVLTLQCNSYMSHVQSFFKISSNQLTWPLGHVSYCHHFSSVVRPSTFHILISPQKPLDQLLSNFGGMVPGWVPFKIVSNSPALHSRWPLLLKIEISSNGQNCSILSQNVPKFELCKHNDELFSIQYRIFYEL